MSNEVSPAPAVGAVVAAEWNRDVLSVTGPDSISFLQGQLSADVEALEVGSSTLSLLLDPGGKMVAVLRLWRTDERIVFIDTDAGSGAQVQDRLSRFLLRTDAEITAHGWQCVAVRGESSASVDVSQTSAVLVGPCVWPGTEGLDLLGPSVSPPASAEPAPEGLLEALRIRSGWPTAAAEVTDDVIPAEIGSWLIGAAVSFTKGCYVGQELTARIDSRGGNTPRNLRRFEVAQPARAGDAVLESGGGDGEPVGTLTSAVRDPRTDTTVALGYVKRGASESRLEVRPS